MEDAKLLDMKINGLHSEVKEVKGILKELSSSMSIVATQTVQIQTIQKNQQEHHEDIDALKEKMNLLSNWQAGCPRAQVSRIWTVIASIAAAYGMMFLYHIFSQAPK